MTEDEESGEGKVAPLMEIMVPYLRARLLESLGKRSISEEDLNELTVYWAATLMPALILRYEKIPSPDDVPEKEIIDHFINANFRSGRGLEQYSRMAGRSLMEIVKSKISKTGQANVLDIGCAEGLFLHELRERCGDPVNCHGVDSIINRDLLSGIQSRLTIAELLPEEWTDRFDLVTCFESTMYFWNQNRAFDEALRVLHPKGNLFYGTGGLKNCGNEDILNKWLRLHDFRYTCPPYHGHEGETYRGADGKQKAYFMEFSERLKEMLGKNGRFERHGKLFDMKKFSANAWCTTTLQVGCLGYADSAAHVQ